VAEQLAREFPRRQVTHIALGEGPGQFDVDTARNEFRANHHIETDEIVFGVHGTLTEEKGISEIVDAFAVTQRWVPKARLLLVGADDPLVRLRNRLSARGVAGAAIHLAALNDVEFDRSIAACDVTINLRWPSALETSGPWVRSLALGRASISIDAAHHAHVPALDPLSWQRVAPTHDLGEDAVGRAVTVAVDVMNLARGLRAAMRRLGTDAALRAAIGRQARLWWEREHTIERMVLDYERALADALAAPIPHADLPPHLRPDPSGSSRQLLGSDEWQDPDVRSRLAGFAS
jgi:glycosyltransferase involved in cell wall biosynthesis